MNKISTSSLNREFRQHEKNISDILRRSLRLLGKDKVALEVYLIGDERMQFLNKKFRRKNKNTNVLSFREEGRFPHPETRLRYLGEIYLNPSYIMKQAKAEAEWSRGGEKLLMRKLAVHGLLHLLGYNHRRKSDKMKMERKEKWLIN